MRKTSSLQDQPLLTLPVIHYGRKDLSKSPCDVVLLAKSLTAAKDYTTWLISNPNGKTNFK